MPSQEHAGAETRVPTLAEWISSFTGLKRPANAKMHQP